MRALFAATLLMLLLPAATATPEATTTEAPLADAYCQDATATQPFVFQASCTHGGLVCTPWFSYWDPIRERAMSFCAI